MVCTKNRTRGSWTAVRVAGMYEISYKRQADGGQRGGMYEKSYKRQADGGQSGRYVRNIVQEASGRRAAWWYVGKIVQKASGRRVAWWYVGKIVQKASGRRAEWPVCTENRTIGRQTAGRVIGLYGKSYINRTKVCDLGRKKIRTCIDSVIRLYCQ